MVQTQYYRIPVREWRGLQARLIRYAQQDQAQANTNFMQRRHLQAMANHNERMSDFKGLLSKCKKTIAVSDKPCTCGKNHHSIQLENGEPVYMCPVIFWLNTCHLIHCEKGLQAMTKWADERPINKYLSRIDKDEDATYDPEMDPSDETDN